MKWKFLHKFQITWLTGPTFVARNHEQIFLDCNSSTFNVKFESTISAANKLMISCNCSFTEYTWVLYRSWVRMNTVEWNFTWIITSISVWTIIDYTTKKSFSHPTSGCYIAISCSRWTPNFAYEKEKDKKPERVKKNSSYSLIRYLLIKFFLLAIAQSNSPLFSYAVFNGIKPLWDETVFPKHIIFLKKIANCLDNLLFLITVFMIRKTSFQNILEMLS